MHVKYGVKYGGVSFNFYYKNMYFVVVLNVNGLGLNNKLSKYINAYCNK